MKRVKYLAAAIPAAVGLAAPVTAAAATTQTPAGTGKTVSLTAAPAARVARSSAAPGGTFSTWIFYSRDNGCIGDVHGILNEHTNTGWWMKSSLTSMAT